MKKKTDRMSIRNTFAIHGRAIKDMRRMAPGCFLSFFLSSIAM